MSNEFKDFINELIKDKGSQEALSVAIGVSQAVVSRWARGEGPQPKIETLIGLAKYSGKRLSTIIKMVYPDAPDDDGISPRSRLFIDDFEKLSESEQRGVLKMIRSFIEERSA